MALFRDGKLAVEALQHSNLSNKGVQIRSHSFHFPNSNIFGLTSHTLRTPCNYRVVAEERNYRTLRLGNKILTSVKHDVVVLHDNGCDLRRAQM